MNRDHIMDPPMRFNDHAFERFVERWWPLTEAEKRLRAAHKKAFVLNLRREVLKLAVCSGAYHVENIPDEKQSVWAFVVAAGPNQGRTALMVVAQDGTVRTVLPPEAQRPANRRRAR